MAKFPLQQAFDDAVNAAWRYVHHVTGSSVREADELAARYAQLAGISGDEAAERILRAVADKPSP